MEYLKTNTDYILTCLLFMNIYLLMVHGIQLSPRTNQDSKHDIYTSNKVTSTPFPRKSTNLWQPNMKLLVTTIPLSYTNVVMSIFDNYHRDCLFYDDQIRMYFTAWFPCS